MKSVVDVINEDNKTHKSLNFTVVGYGQRDVVQKFLKYTSKQISAHVIDQPVMLYTRRTLDLAETKPELLYKGIHMPMRSVCNASSREYIGFLNSVDRDALYRYLYATPADVPLSRQELPNYSRSNLSRIIHEKFGTTESDIDSMLGDLEVRIIQNCCEQKNLYIRIEYKISQRLIQDIFSYVDWFRYLVKKMDIQFPETFRSAYISLNNSQMPIVHEYVCNSYNIEQAQSMILGTEWYGYFNKRIADHLDEASYKKLAEVTQITQMQNGISYVATTDIAEFNALLREKISKILRGILIPAIGIYEWSRLCNQRWKVQYLPIKVDVYHDTYTPEDPTVVLSYNSGTEQLVMLHGIELTNLIDSF